VTAVDLPPSRILLRAIRLLHERGATSIRAFPTFYATGHWRCSLMLGETVIDELRYSEGMGWSLPGRTDDTPTDPQGAADSIWAALTAEQRAAALVPDPAYAAWWAALLEVCGDDNVPYYYSDESNPYRDGYVGISRSTEKFPLPPEVAA